ncbi:MAG TPA: TonB family protein [Candidatus Acidoferrales bacterium]|nr:TonB family protein [Candidatus Acidoferrales bacterium]
MATLTQSFLQGEIVEEKYVLMRYLGGSEHSSVFQTQYGGVHPRDAAIKLLPAPPGNAEARLSGWRLAANISHPHLMRIIDMGRCEVANAPMLFVVTELAGENLADILPERSLTAAEAQEMLTSLLDALVFLHNRGFVHGHIKPSNIMAIGDDLKLSADTICRLGEVVENGGVPSMYDAPEGMRSGASSKADIWSLGVTLVEVLTQQKLDWTPSTRRDPLVPESMPAGFAEMARHCLRRGPDKRWTAATIQSHLPKVMAKPVSSRAAEGIAQAAPHFRDALSRTAHQLPQIVHGAAKLAPKVREASRAMAPIAERVSAQISKIPSFIAPIVRAAREIQIPKIGLQHARKYGTGAAVLGVGLVAIAAGVKFAGHSGAAPASVAEPPTIAAAKPVQPPRHEKLSVEEHRRHEAARAERSRAPERIAAAPRPSIPPTSEREVAKSSANPAVANTAAVSRSAVSTPSVASGGASSNGSNGLVAGRVVQRVLPDVPRSASNTIWGTVRVGVRVLVDASGNVTQAELQSAGPSRYFARLSLAAARKWQFAAPTQNGATVASVWLLHFGYRRTGTAVEPSQVKP